MIAASAAPAQSADAAAAKAAVQGFYDWYGPFTNAADNKEDVSAVLRDRKDDFDPALAAALAADAAAKAKAEGEEVGIDYDPFVNAQDTCGQQQRFEVGNAHAASSKATVEVYAICDGKKEDKPRVLVTLSLRDGKWVFTDFGTLDDPHQLTKALGGSGAAGANAEPAKSTSRQQLSKVQYQAIYDDCMKAAGEVNNGVVDDCASKQADAAEREIGMLQKKIRDDYAAVDREKAKQFDRAQAAWVTSRDTDCALEGGAGVETCTADKDVDRVIALRHLAQ